jgi:glycosyltransferase involved in cell wall biosynthesis
MTDALRYGRNPEWKSIRVHLRNQLGFKQDQFVFLAVTKFVRRENPLGILRAFSYAFGRAATIGLILVGAEPMESEVRAWHESHVRQSAVLPGYIPYQGLGRYFFASDAFVHLPEEGCWETSPQDALVAELGLICSNRTGAGLNFLTGALREFLVNYDDPEEAGRAMIKLFELGDQIPLRFEGAWRKAREEYTVQSVARLWWKKMQGAFC